MSFKPLSLEDLLDFSLHQLAAGVAISKSELLDAILVQHFDGALEPKRLKALNLQLNETLKALKKLKLIENRGQGIWQLKRLPSYEERRTINRRLRERLEPAEAHPLAKKNTPSASSLSKSSTRHLKTIGIPLLVAVGLALVLTKGSLGTQLNTVGTNSGTINNAVTNNFGREPSPSVDERKLSSRGRLSDERDSAPQARETMSLQMAGPGAHDGEYETSISVQETETGKPIYILPAYWSVVLSNLGETTLSTLSHETFMVGDSFKRAVESRFFSPNFVPIDHPIVIPRGESRKFLLKAPMRLSERVYAAAQSSNRFSAKFLLKDFHSFLESNDLDILGKNIRRARKCADNTVDTTKACYIFTSSDEGNLLLDLKTAQGNHFSADAHYYFQPTHNPTPTIYVPRGEPLNLRFDMKPMDSLPKEHG